MTFGTKKGPTSGRCILPQSTARKDPSGSTSWHDSSFILSRAYLYLFLFTLINTRKISLLLLFVPLLAGPSLPLLAGPSLPLLAAPSLLSSFFALLEILKVKKPCSSQPDILVPSLILLLVALLPQRLIQLLPLAVGAVFDNPNDLLVGTHVAQGLAQRKQLMLDTLLL